MLQQLRTTGIPYLYSKLIFLDKSCLWYLLLLSLQNMASKLKLRDPLGILVTFKDMWYQIFLYCLATTVLMHGLASLIALRALRKHKPGRYIPIVIAVTGFLYPLTGGVITSALIAWIYQAAKIHMENYFAFLWGGGQALVLFVVSFTRILGTL